MGTTLRNIVVAATLIGFTGCDSPTEPVRLLIPALTLEAVGDSRQLEASIIGSNVLPEWESLNPELVTVTRAGMVTALAPGEAKVRARIGGSVAEGRVTVLPPANVVIANASRQVAVSGAVELALRLQNTGGRGYYRMDLWQARQTPDGEHQPVLRFTTDSEAPAGMDIVFRSGLPGMERVDWVMIHSRDPGTLGYRATSCVRLDGGTPCPIP
jgi:hypothetical protein